MIFRIAVTVDYARRPWKLTGGAKDSQKFGDKNTYKTRLTLAQSPSLYLLSGSSSIEHETPRLLPVYQVEVSMIRLSLSSFPCDVVVKHIGYSTWDLYLGHMVLVFA